MIQVIDNIISETYQNELEDTLFSESFNKITSPKIRYYSNGNIGHEHWFIKKSQYLNMHQLIIPLFEEISKKSGILGKISDARTFLQEKSTNQNIHDIIHVDMVIPHFVFLYYVNNSDGETILFDKRHTYGNSQFLVHGQKPNPLEKITPQKGRVLIFDGLTYHAAGIPKENNRCVINFNII
jgi:ectoine hydroxylase-related dioxygenase (phytanoyl-CoA dioxygenase family)